MGIGEKIKITFASSSKINIGKGYVSVRCLELFLRNPVFTLCECASLSGDGILFARKTWTLLGGPVARQLHWRELSYRLRHISIQLFLSRNVGPVVWYCAAGRPLTKTTVPPREDAETPPFDTRPELPVSHRCPGIHPSKSDCRREWISVWSVSHADVLLDMDSVHLFCQRWENCKRRARTRQRVLQIHSVDSMLGDWNQFGFVSDCNSLSQRLRFQRCRSRGSQHCCLDFIQRKVNRSKSENKTRTSISQAEHGTRSTHNQAGS